MQLDGAGEGAHPRGVGDRGGFEEGAVPEAVAGGPLAGHAERHHRQLAPALHAAHPPLHAHLYHHQLHVPHRLLRPHDVVPRAVPPLRRVRDGAPGQRGVRVRRDAFRRHQRHALGPVGVRRLDPGLRLHGVPHHGRRGRAVQHCRRPGHGPPGQEVLPRYAILKSRRSYLILPRTLKVLMLLFTP